MKMLKANVWLVIMATFIIFLSSCNTQDEVVSPKEENTTNAESYSTVIYKGKSYANGVDDNVRFTNPVLQEAADAGGAAILFNDDGKVYLFDTKEEYMSSSVYEQPLKDGEKGIGDLGKVEFFEGAKFGTSLWAYESGENTSEVDIRDRRKDNVLSMKVENHSFSINTLRVTIYEDSYFNHKHNNVNGTPTKGTWLIAKAGPGFSSNRPSLGKMDRKLSSYKIEWI